jgi:hypothetical protein
VLRAGARRLPRGWARQAKQAQADLVVIDGYEQLGLWGRFVVRFSCGRNGWGLLVTTHRDAGLPTLCATLADLTTVQTIVRQLAGEDERIAREVVADCFAACNGNVRETLFALYDRWEADTPVRGNATPARSASEGD